MAGFYIKKVVAKSAIKGDASVSFGKGLTIIQGRSDSGKTCVANCIDFVFGGSVDKPFKETAKYDGVTMIVGSNDRDGEVTLHRNVGKNQVEVTSTIDGIDSGTYDVNYRKGAKNPPLNEVWLKLIGIEQETMIVTNARFEKKRLTWRNLLRVFYLDENRIDDIDSIVEPKHRYMENTLFLSALLYLITGRTFTETDAQEKKEIKKARRKAVAEYVNRKIRDAAHDHAQLAGCGFVMLLSEGFWMLLDASAGPRQLSRLSRRVHSWLPATSWPCRASAALSASASSSGRRSSP